jgi:hypothetical protein
MTDEMDNRFDELLRDAARTYNRPPDERDMPLDDMWSSIEAQTFPHARRATRYVSWFGIAAALVVGVGIGRLSSYTRRSDSPVANSPGSSTTPAPGRPPIVAVEPPAAAIDPTTSRYLGQAAALLIALPAEANVRAPDQSFARRASELLLTTRLLLDSQAGSDPAMRNLLEDLELVLVQVVRLEKERAPTRRTELELIQQALDQRDVIPRLRNAASEYASDD